MKVVHGPTWLTAIEWRYTIEILEHGMGIGRAPIVYYKEKDLTYFFFTLTLSSTLTIKSVADSIPIYFANEIPDGFLPGEITRSIRALPEEYCVSITDENQIVLGGYVTGKVGNLHAFMLSVVRKLKHADNPAGK